MTESKDVQTKSSRLGSNLGSLVTALLLLVLLFVATLIGGALVVLVGRVLNLIFGLSLFEGTLIALVTAMSIGYFLLQVLRPQFPFSPTRSDWDAEDFEDEEDWEEDEDDWEEDEGADWEEPAKDVVIPPVGRNAPCPCGSGKKYKHCHGR